MNDMKIQGKMKNRVIAVWLGITMLFTGFILISDTVSATTLYLYVGPGGNSQTINGAVQIALGHPTATDVFIYVQSNYDNNLEPSTISITTGVESARSITIDGNDKDLFTKSNNPVFDISYDYGSGSNVYLTISNLNIKMNSIPATAQAAIYIFHSRGVIIDNVDISKTGALPYNYRYAYGIYAGGSDLIRVVSCDVKDCRDYGIYYENVDNRHLQSVSWGIWYSSVSINGNMNSPSRSRAGVYLDDCIGGYYRCNEIKDNYGNGLFIKSSTGMTIGSNSEDFDDISGNSVYGILLNTQEVDNPCTDIEIKNIKIIDNYLFEPEVYGWLNSRGNVQMVNCDDIIFNNFICKYTSYQGTRRNINLQNVMFSSFRGDDGQTTGNDNYPRIENSGTGINMVECQNIIFNFRTTSSLHTKNDMDQNLHFYNNRKSIQGMDCSDIKITNINIGNNFEVGEIINIHFSLSDNIIFNNQQGFVGINNNNIEGINNLKVGILLWECKDIEIGQELFFKNFYPVDSTCIWMYDCSVSDYEMNIIDYVTAEHINTAIHIEDSNSVIIMRLIIENDDNNIPDNSIGIKIEESYNIQVGDNNEDISFGRIHYFKKGISIENCVEDRSDSPIWVYQGWINNCEIGVNIEDSFWSNEQKYHGIILEGKGSSSGEYLKIDGGLSDICVNINRSEVLMGYVHLGNWNSNKYAIHNFESGYVINNKRGDHLEMSADKSITFTGGGGIYVYTCGHNTYSYTYDLGSYCVSNQRRNSYGRYYTTYS